MANLPNAIPRPAPSLLPIKIPSILVVDDVPANLELLAGMLRERGYEPRPVRSGRMALQAAMADPPDLILLDIHMPEMDGYEVCRRLKEEEKLREIPVLFLSAMNETADKIRGFAAGAVDYVTKPFHVEEIIARVETHLELRRQKLELRHSYDKLHETEMMRDNLVHMIVHDMRSPLTAVLGNLNLAAYCPMDDRVRHCVEEALIASNRLLNMTTTLLDVNKMEGGKMQVDLVETDLCALCDQVLRSMEPLRGARHIILVSPCTSLLTRCDVNLTERVLMNLLSNAITHTVEDTGNIELTLSRGENGGIRVAVRDNGRGIPQEFQHKVFDKFSQVEARRQGQPHSSGLGLTFCKLAVEAHGGRIGLQSEPEIGSTFWFELPG